MSSLRQIKTLLILDIIIITFSVWTAITNLLFKNVVDYKLFFLSLATVFLMQYIYFRKNNKYLAFVLPMIITIPIIWVLFDGITILLNLVLVAACLFISFTIEDLPLDYEEYKSKAKLGAVILIITFVMSLGLEEVITDYLYRLIINYIIITVIFLRESRAYYYKVRIEDKEKVKVIKSLFTNIFFQYAIAIISTIILTTDWILNKSFAVFSILNKGADFVISGILVIAAKIIEPILITAINVLRRYLINTNFSLKMDQLSQGLSNITKNTDFNSGGATAAENSFMYTTIKITILVIVILVIVDALEKMKFLKFRSEQYIEEKEKIDRNSKDQKDNNHKNNISTILKNVFRMNKTIKERILNTYREFEKITGKAEIYKSYMTATQLKNAVKLSIENDDYLDDMTDIYNEVKFSNNDPKEKQLDIVKKCFDNMKEQL